MSYTWQKKRQKKNLYEMGNVKLNLELLNFVVKTSIILYDF
jgi:hypothetical protein